MSILLQEAHLSRTILLLFIPKTAKRKEEQALGEGESCVIGLSVFVSQEKPTVEVMIANLVASRSAWCKERCLLISAP